jgi:hypothetical protein
MELVKIKGGTRRSVRPAVISPEQLGMLLENIQEDYVRLVVIISICLGLRFSEVHCNSKKGSRRRKSMRHRVTTQRRADQNPPALLSIMAGHNQRASGGDR